MISPEEVAQAILYFASDASAMVTGTALAIDGGKSLRCAAELTLSKRVMFHLISSRPLAPAETNSCYLELLRAIVS